MKKISLGSAEPVPFNLDGKFMFRSANYELVHLTLQPGESIPLHSNPFDVVFFIIEGTATLITDSDLQELHANDSVFIKQSVNRGLENNTNQQLRLLVNKLLQS